MRQDGADSRVDVVDQEIEKLRDQLKEKVGRSHLLKTWSVTTLIVQIYCMRPVMCFSEIVTGVEPALGGTKTPNCGCVIRLFQKSNIISQIF